MLDTITAAHSRFDRCGDHTRALREPRLPVYAQSLPIAGMQGGKAKAAWAKSKDGKPSHTVKITDKGRVGVTWVAGGESSSFCRVNSEPNESLICKLPHGAR